VPQCARDDITEFVKPPAFPTKISLDPAMARPKKRSLTVAGHRTSITLEDAFWQALKAAAEESGVSAGALVSAIDEARGGASLSAAIRVFLFARQKPQLGER
jgi:predicted DNA-binding ribbon-helix-helix protein